MAHQPSQRSTARPNSAEEKGHLASEIPPEHAITRLYVLPAGSAAAFMAEIEDDTEEPTSALRELLRGAVG